MRAQTAESSPLIARYVAAAEAYGKAVEAVDPECIHTVQAAIQAAVQTLDDLRLSQAVLPLLDDDRLAVRYCAAVDALNLAPARAESVLEAIANGSPSPIQLMALFSLGKWRQRRSHG